MRPSNASSADESFIKYPLDRIAGTLASRTDAEAVVEALLQVGIRVDDIDVLHAEAGLRRVDPTGASHGLLARLRRAFIDVAAAHEESGAARVVCARTASVIPSCSEA